MANDGSVPESAGEVTALLREWAAGRREAFDRLVPLVYDELRALAAAYLRRERVEHTLQPTAVVHEAYFRLIGAHDIGWENRSHFFGIAARAMRRILVEHARARSRQKRTPVTLAAAAEPALEPIDLLALDVALERLAALDAEQARLVELRYFAGLSIEESAAALGSSPATVKRDWRSARAFLHRELGLGGSR